MNFFKTSVLFIFVSLFSCQPAKQVADMMLMNGNIYTADAGQKTVEAIAIKDGKILGLGSADELKELQGPDSKIIDLKGQFVMPGFIEGHGHFSGLGSSLMDLNFLKSKSWDEIVGLVSEKIKETKPGEWVVGRGWHQEKWMESPEKQVLGYPYHYGLSDVSPDNPVLLVHASGHSLFANAKAMELAGISIETPNPVGGEIVRDVSGVAIGVFEERGMAPVRAAYRSYLNTLDEKALQDRWLEGIHLAQEECLSKGITSFQDAGSSYQEIEDYKKLAAEGKLDLRLWVMLRHSYDRMKDNMKGFPVIDYGNHFFTCRAIKSELDGALGAYGAWLLESYEDKANFIGQNTTTLEEMEDIARLCAKHDMQMCVHAIGDKANQETLNIYEKVYSENSNKKDMRWRIEHAQHLALEDIPRFKELGVIAAMQGIHCTSDAPYVEKRLGYQRSKEGAYPWRALLDAGAVIANGTDAPVEDVSALESFYASVTRKRIDNGFEFFPEQCMTREEAIHSYTLGAAYAAFEEDQKGSLEAGKFADIVVLSKDLLHCSDEEILETKVLMTIVGGAIKYEHDGANF